MPYSQASRKPNFNRWRQQSHKGSRPKIKNYNPTEFVQQHRTTNVKSQPVVIQHQFADFKLHQVIADNIHFRGYETLTPIQDQVIPVILSGKDVVGIANTGTGKTAAFLIPLIERNLIYPELRTLIVAPTRELVVQINAEFKNLGKNTNLYSAVCIGGVGKYQQLAELRRQPRFVIGTPGRLLDFFRQKDLVLSTFNTIVLDEVDQMLDMGFINDIKTIIQNLKKPRQSLFFSATLPISIEPVMQQFLSDPVIISTAKKPTVAAVKQQLVPLNGRNKVEVLQELLKTHGFDKVLVFLRTKHGTNHLARSLQERGIQVVAIHGNKSQSQRQTALNLFRNDRVKVLLATDIASRGLDIQNVSHVINYDLPGSHEDYIHRIGRTARAEQSGHALTLVD